MMQAVFALNTLLRAVRSDGDPADPGASFFVPDGVRAYAIGDVHGELGLLRALHAEIEADIEAAPDTTPVEIYLGDYVDRGPDSAGVIDVLAQLAEARDRERVFLRGNHETFLIDFLDDPWVLEGWLRNGGAATLRSYGVAVDADRPNVAATQRALNARLPDRHKAFLSRLDAMCRLGEVVFAHAGIRPGVALERQTTEDLTMIRRDFLRSRQALPARVVHGHTIVAEPEATPYRVAVDTGAYATGRLTCAVLEGDSVRFLTARDERAAQATRLI